MRFFLAFGYYFLMKNDTFFNVLACWPHSHDTPMMVFFLSLSYSNGFLFIYFCILLPRERQFWRAMCERRVYQGLSSQYTKCQVCGTVYTQYGYILIKIKTWFIAIYIVVHCAPLSLWRQRLPPSPPHDTNGYVVGSFLAKTKFSRKTSFTMQQLATIKLNNTNDTVSKTHGNKNTSSWYIKRTMKNV